jgi:hypothetical protein
MVLPALRGIAKLMAGVTGLLLVYGAVYAMEGMTTRIPMNRWHELAVTSLWMLPWTLLFCSGLEDLGTAAQKAWVFWIGAGLALILLCYFERNTTSTILTKIAMPVLAVSGGLLPHIIRRIRFVFVVCNLATGVAGTFILYLVLRTFLSPATSFANKGVEAVIVAFGVSAFATGVLAAASLRRTAH